MKVKAGLLSLIFPVLLFCACLPAPPESHGERSITIYGFSIMREPLEKAVIPAFQKKWKTEHGVDVNIIGSYAGSETVTNQILQGVPADIAILSIERDVTRLVEGKAVTADWRAMPNKGIVNKTPFVILVRKGNPKNIRDFPDLGRPGVAVIHPDPVSSGGAQWSLLAMYGSELKKSEAETGAADPLRATHTLQAIWKNVVSTPDSARAARTQFETGYGDALITYELEGLMMKDAGSAAEVVVPRSTIFSEHPAAIIDRNVTPDERPVVEAFLRFLWSDEAQESFVKYYFRSATNEKFNETNPRFAKIEIPFTVDFLGGWDKAYPDVIENVFIKQVKPVKPN